MEINVIKVGGAVVENPTNLAILLDTFAAIPESKVLVHGGGRSATNLATRMGLETQMVEGRRITDSEMLSVVTMTYGGLVNKNIVAQLQARQLNALGLTGVDLNLIQAHKRPVTPEGVDFGWVGDVDAVNGKMLQLLLLLQTVPVVAPLTHDGQGHLLNTNADTMAASVAEGLAQEQENTVTLTFCFELPGVLRDPHDVSSVIAEIHEADFPQLVAEGIVSGGMIPKIQNAFDAIHKGVKRVVITRFDNLQGGTIICA